MYDLFILLKSLALKKDLRETSRIMGNTHEKQYFKVGPKGLPGP